jgi:hypothetical protein
MQQFRVFLDFNQELQGALDQGKRFLADITEVIQASF